MEFSCYWFHAKKSWKWTWIAIKWNLFTLTVGPCALDYTKMKTPDHYWTDPPADELVQRHRIHSNTSHLTGPGSPKRPGLQVDSLKYLGKIPLVCRRSSFLKLKFQVYMYRVCCRGNCLPCCHGKALPYMEMLQHCPCEWSLPPLS